MSIDFKKPTPLYQQIVDDIKNKIVNGQLRVGDQVGSHQELAQRYNVSLITVKKALAELISAGILFSRVGRGTYVAPLLMPSQHDQKLFGLVLRDLKDPFFSLILHSVEANASKNGYSLLLANTSDLLEKEAAMTRNKLKAELIASLGGNG